MSYKYVNEHMEDGIISVWKSAENDGNILTKNLGGELHKKCTEWK